MLTFGHGKRLAFLEPQRGFSLIELLFALTLLGILLGLGLPSFADWIRNGQIRTVAEALQDGLRTAQAEAVRRNQQVVISFTNDVNPQKDPTAVVDGRSWSIQTVSSAYIDGGASKFVRSASLTDVASTIQIVSDPSTKAICFNGNGRLMDNSGAPTPTATCAVPAASPGRVSFDVRHPASGTRTLRVTVSVGGQVRICDPARPTLSVSTPDGCPA